MTLLANSEALSGISLGTGADFAMSLTAAGNLDLLQGGAGAVDGGPVHLDDLLALLARRSS